jgi:pimeloyl-ACP methyl ester carboxylesterase
LSTKPTIVFVHGMFMTGASWQPWVDEFGARGYPCIAESWPGRAGSTAERRAQPNPELSRLTLSQVVARFREIVAALPAPPILVGHSMGGLVVQLLMQEGLGARGVAIASAPPTGVRSFAWSHLRSNAAVLWPSNAPIVPSLGWFRYAFANVQPETEVQAMFERDVVCESRLVGKGPLGPEAKVDFARPDRPLHFIAGGADHIIPPSLVQKTYARYLAAGARVSMETIAGETHALCSSAGWRGVAARVSAWLEV